jgi:hypothetical protein
MVQPAERVVEDTKRAADRSADERADKDTCDKLDKCCQILENLDRRLSDLESQSAPRHPFGLFRNHGTFCPSP